MTVSDYALLDASNVVVGVVRWDGDTTKWQPPPEVVRWVDVGDPDLFVEKGGTLNPNTLRFTRNQPSPPPPAAVMAATPISSRAAARLERLLNTLAAKGAITAQDVADIDTATTATR